MSKQFLAIVAVIILVFVGIFALSNHKSTTGNGSTSGLTNHVEGLGKDNVTLVEYGDYQCPYCGAAFSAVKQAQSEFNQQMTFQFRNFPLVSLHQNAFASARAAEAAGLQNKYWEMHDILYEQNQVYYNSGQKIGTWINASDPTTDFAQYAQQIGLNVAKFKTDYASSKVNDYINADMNQGTKLGVNSTPAFYLDGKPISFTSYTLSAFEKVINAELAKKTASPAKS